MEMIIDNVIIAKKLSKIIMMILHATREKGLSDEMYKAVNLLQDLRDYLQ